MAGVETHAVHLCVRSQSALDNTADRQLSVTRDVVTAAARRPGAQAAYNYDAISIEVFFILDPASPAAGRRGLGRFGHGHRRGVQTLGRCVRADQNVRRCGRGRRAARVGLLGGSPAQDATVALATMGFGMVIGLSRSGSGAATRPRCARWLDDSACRQLGDSVGLRHASVRRRSPAAAVLLGMSAVSVLAIHGLSAEVSCCAVDVTQVTGTRRAGEVAAGDTGVRWVSRGTRPGDRQSVTATVDMSGFRSFVRVVVGDIRGSCSVRGRCRGVRRRHSERQH